MKNLAISLFLFLAFIMPSFASAQEEGNTATSVTDTPRDEESVNMLRYNPMYFAYGEPTAKIQFSMKYRLYKPLPLYFAYTQLMFWALSAESKPFRDINFNPELFYTYTTDPGNLLSAVDFGFLEHDSNGKDGPDSRSYNRSYLRAHFYQKVQDWLFKASVKFSFKYDFDEGNRDIPDYIGPFEYRLSTAELLNVGWIDKTELSIKAVPGGKYGQNWNMGGYEFGFSFRLGGLKVAPGFYLQYYTGYGESLITYNQRTDIFRGGIIF